MTNPRLLPVLQVFCTCLVVLGTMDGIGAFQPLHRNAPLATRWQTKSNRNPPLSSSVSMDASERKASGVRVVDAAALVNGPAHVASLESQTKKGDLSSQQNKNESNESIPTSLSSSTFETQDLPQTTTSNSLETKKPTAPKQTAKSPVTIVESAEELVNLMDCTNADETSDLTLVLFHAHYCKICQRATMQLTKAAREYPNVHFAKVESKVIPEPQGDNLRALGITKFPFVQIFRHGDCVASFSTGPTHMFMRSVRGTLDLCLGRDDQAWKDFSMEFQQYIQENRDARGRVLPHELLP